MHNDEQTELTKRRKREDRPVEPRLMSVRRWCAAYDRSPSWLYAMLKIGKLQSVKVGRSRLIPVSEGERLVREGLK